jgi:hypothetical protein
MRLHQLRRELVASARERPRARIVPDVDARVEIEVTATSMPASSIYEIIRPASQGGGASSLISSNI